MARDGVGAGGYRYLRTVEDIVKSVVSVDFKFRPVGSRVLDDMVCKYGDLQTKKKKRE
jgi:hypothetical protein